MTLQFILIVYDDIDNAIHALKSEEVHGMMLDRYTASFYQKQGKLKSLVTVNKMDLQRDVGLLFSKDREFIADCLEYDRPEIYQFGQSLTNSYKVTGILFSILFSIHF